MKLSEIQYNSATKNMKKKSFLLLKPFRGKIKVKGSCGSDDIENTFVSLKPQSVLMAIKCDIKARAANLL
jgi:hypothetical protein